VKIALIANGPSARVETDADKVFRTNHWYLQGGTCTDWFIGEHSEAVHAAAAYCYGRDEKPIIWFPGLSGDAIFNASRCIKGASIKVQKHFQHLPALCRWDSDPRPRRPLMGSWALAVAVGMQPDVLEVSGIDLYQHANGDYSTPLKPPDNRAGSGEAYLQGLHPNHGLLGDLRYIRHALDAFSGKLVCHGSVMKKYFANDYKRWEWYDG
jgi:hypothetical protein